MKKAKIMLTAITVLAVVGGALAFKAQKFSTIVCSAPFQQGVDPTKVSCPTRLLHADPQAGTGFFYTIVNASTPCTNLKCATTGDLPIEP